MQFFEVAGIIDTLRQSGRLHWEFLRTPEMSAGIYELGVGGTDAQQPHAEAEMYYVLSGRARFRAGDEECAVQSGSVLFVAAGVEHRFHTISEPLTLLVFFAPAEGTNKQEPHI
jgi:mannose-6-phosphate isomerase-like protein (cupin superfamily)